MKTWAEDLRRKLGYKGCRNCENQIGPLRTCEWHERTPQNTLHIICPMWKKKEKKDGNNEI